MFQYPHVLPTIQSLQLDDYDFDIYSQRVDNNGNIQWTTDGVVICNESGTDEGIQICSDGGGGAIITWSGFRSGSDYNIYAQRIDINGNIQWATNGVIVCAENEAQREPQICSDGAGGAVIIWEDQRDVTVALPNNYDIYAQRIDSNGVIQWDVNGEVICNNSEAQYDPKICSDGAGGAIITWEDTRNVDYNIYAQKIDTSGLTSWTDNGTVVRGGQDGSANPKICIDGTGGAFITWEETRDDFFIYGLRIDATGVLKWISSGIPIAPYIISDDSSNGDGDGDGDGDGNGNDCPAPPLTGVETILIIFPLFGIMTIIIAIIHRKFKTSKD